MMHIWQWERKQTNKFFTQNSRIMSCSRPTRTYWSTTNKEIEFWTRYVHCIKIGYKLKIIKFSHAHIFNVLHLQHTNDRYNNTPDVSSYTIGLFLMERKHFYFDNHFMWWCGVLLLLFDWTAIFCLFQRLNYH